MRLYCKATELNNKLKPKDRPAFVNVLAEYKEHGVARFEYMDRHKKGLIIESLIQGPQVFANRFEGGFSNSTVTVGSLDRLLLDLYMSPLSSRRKSTLHAFVDLYAKYGEQGTREFMPSSTFRRKKRQFLDLGFALNNLNDVYAELHYAPVLDELRA